MGDKAIGIVNMDNRFYVAGELGGDFSAWWEGGKIYVNNNGVRQQLKNAGKYKKGDKVCVSIKVGKLWWTKNGKKAGPNLSLPTNDKKYAGAMQSGVLNQKVLCVRN